MRRFRAIERVARRKLLLMHRARGTQEEWMTTKHTREEPCEPDLLDPIHPGEILLEEFMRPMSLSQNRLARDLDVGPARIHGIIHGTRALTADTALRLIQDSQ